MSTITMGKQRLAGLLAALLLCACLPLTVFAAGDGLLTRGAACAMLVQAADDYHPGVSESDVMRGDRTGKLWAERPVTRAEAMVMLVRAFGELPAPVGDNARRAYPDQRFQDVPDWAAAELSSLFRAGLVTAAGEDTLAPDAPMTEGELTLLIRRVYALEGSNLKDDFFAAVNKETLEKSVILPGRVFGGGTYAINDQVSADLSALIAQVARQSYPKGTGEQKVADLYHTILDWESRERTGLAPLKPYLDAVDGAQSLDELMDAHGMAARALGWTSLLGFSLTVDVKDSSSYVVSFSTFAPGLTKNVFEADSGDQKEAYLRYLTTLLTLGGEDAEQAAAGARACYEAERAVALDMLDPEERYEVEKTYNLYTMQELQAIFPRVDLARVLADSGLRAEERFLVEDPGMARAAAAYFNEAHLDVLKTAMKLGLLMGCGGYLNRSFREAGQVFRQELLGVEGRESDEEAAAAKVRQALSPYVERLYVQNCFSLEAKADVEALVREILAVYRERILALDWMSGATKAMAVKKLDAMGVKVGYPEQWDNRLDGVEIKGPAEGGSYFENMLALSRAARAYVAGLQGQRVDKNRWVFPAFEANACYDPTANDITFPAGYLRAPAYDLNAPREQNLGGIGAIIAHEITHAFDNSGSAYDEYGNAADWWTVEDRAAFEALCARVVAFYDGAEAMPGITCDGTLTLSENVADLGAAACMTELVRREGGDLALMYRSFSKTWGVTTTRAFTEHLCQSDPHAPCSLRGYLPLQGCDEFYAAFDIRPGDGMWVDPEDRVRIW